MILEVLGNIVLVAYVICLLYITVYCMFQFHLLIHYLSHHRRESKTAKDKPELNGHIPIVTIQLPLFNEYYVVDRLIDNICLIDYPKDKLEIQVLDDSTDETIERTTAKVKEYQAKGFDIKVIQRTDRKGYKAGALKEATLDAKGEFIAIFDADFLPDKDFLKNTIPHFNNEKVAVVQTKWGHINQGYSLITQMQALQLNVHFTVEQQGRESGNYLLQFNGTAGVWRAAAIADAGGWEADTLTEDLDLSYRAQLKGWQIIYLEEVTSPAELPAEMIGLKSQQYRWMKGGAETAKKLLPKIWKSPISAKQKLHASMHLLGSSVFLFVFMIGVFSVPLIYVIDPLSSHVYLLNFFFVSMLMVILVYYVANVQASWKGQSKVKSIFKFIILFPVFLSLSMGLSFHNSIAVLAGYMGKKSSFVRTPKFNITGIKDSFKKAKYQGVKISPVTILEGFLAIYFLMAIIAGLSSGNITMLLFHISLFAGYSTIFFYSVKHLSYQSAA